MLINFGVEVYELLAEAIAADEIHKNRDKAEDKLAFVAECMARRHGGTFPDHATLVLPDDFAERPELTEILVNYTGGQPVRFSETRISPEIIHQVNLRYTRNQ